MLMGETPLVVLAHQILIHPGFHVGRSRTSSVVSGGRIRAYLQLGADLAGVGNGVVHLPVDGARDLLRKVREANDQAGEAHAVYADRAGLHADDAPGRIRRLRSGRDSRRQSRDKAGDAQMLPEEAGFHRRSGGISVVQSLDGPVAVAFWGRLDGPARVGVRIVAGQGAVTVLVRGHGYRDPV